MAGRRRRKWLLGLLLLAVAYTTVIYAAIVRQSHKDEARRAEAIVVFGAAEYSGRPSPVFKARLDHAAELYNAGFAPIIIATGGAGDDLRYSEGEVGREYLKALGIPDDHLIAETQSSDTAESARRVGNILHANGMKNCLAVSDGYHIFRIKQMLGREGITTYGAPRANSRPATLWKRNESIFHEAFSYTLWLFHLS
ncbi:MAG: YdcF family protein [Acidobacteriia bacterium]|nr:YdcF family protein [Terriglobia bacterium]